MQEIDYEQIAGRITISTANKLKQKNDLSLIGTGGSMMDDVKMMAMSFQYFHPLSVKNGRSLIIACVEQYLSDINSNEKIRPYLHEFPFKPKNLTIRIFCEDYSTKQENSNNLWGISFRNNTIYYYINDKNELIETLHKETYDEALEILSNQNSSN